MLIVQPAKKIRHAGGQRRRLFGLQGRGRSGAQRGGATPDLGPAVGKSERNLGIGQSRDMPGSVV